MKTKCANCEIFFSWKATMVDGIPYCCAGCAEGGPCECDYDHLPARAAIIRHVHFEITVSMPAPASAGPNHTNI